MYLAGMPIDLIMFCGGWRKRSQCENYIKATVSDVLKKLEKTDYFAAWGEQISIKDVTVGWVKEHLRLSGQSVKNLAEKLMTPEKNIEDAFESESLSSWQKALFYFCFKCL